MLFFPLSSLYYIESGIPLGARFLPLSYIGVVVGCGENVFDLSNRGAAALEESEHLFIYTLLLYSKTNIFCPHIFHPSMFPLLVCSTGSVGGAFIVG